ncbi:hypothetical protein [Flavobacterium suaedae]|nr:hypothetical protein [Flavobacterium suaedae]
MKYILFFCLISLMCSAQDIKDNTKVIAYRYGTQSSNYFSPPCNIITDLKKQTTVNNVIQASVSYDSETVYKLLQLKKQAKKNWYAEECICKEGERRGGYIPNMYIVQVNNYRDTIYTTQDNCALFFPDEQMKYYDDESLLQDVLNKTFGAFLSRDFKKEIALREYDSISVNRIRINDKPVYNFTRKKFEKEVTPFQLVRTDSLFFKPATVSKEYWVNNIEAQFENSGKLSQINMHYNEISYPEVFNLTVADIGVGDSEEKILDTYSCSTTFRNWGAPLSEPDNNYYYQISFTEGKGFAFIYIRDKKVERIEVTFFN